MSTEMHTVNKLATRKIGELCAAYESIRKISVGDCAVILSFKYLRQSNIFIIIHCGNPLLGSITTSTDSDCVKFVRYNFEVTFRLHVYNC